MESNPKNTIKFLFSYGGKILPRLTDGKLRYTGGHTRVLALPPPISFSGSFLIPSNFQFKHSYTDTTLTHPYRNDIIECNHICLCSTLILVECQRTLLNVITSVSVSMSDIDSCVKVYVCSIYSNNFCVFLITHVSNIII